MNLIITVHFTEQITLLMMLVISDGDDVSYSTECPINAVKQTNSGHEHIRCTVGRSKNEFHFLDHCRL